CFQRAIDADANCAMAYWGIAYAAGPNYNMPWALYDAKSKSQALQMAFDATQTALELSVQTTPLEQALIAALKARYPKRIIDANMAEWDRNFAQVMRLAFNAHSHSLDMLSIYVEALLNCTPWKMWEISTGTPAAGAYTLDAMEQLERAFATKPGAMQHPGLLHLYIHLMEMSPFPERALKAAEALRNLVPDAGHLIHMPTHIDLLCGDYQNVVRWNSAAVAADLKYYEREGAYNIYTGYRQHNYHFIIYGAMFLGQYAPAMKAAREMWDTTPEAMLRVQTPPMADYFESYLSMEPHILIRFGKWKDAINLTLPKDQTLYCSLTALVHYARALGHAALKDVASAKQEEQLFLKAAQRVPESRRLHNNKVIDLLAIAKSMLAGEISYREGRFENAFSCLRNAIILEDNLPYDEPWGWMQPTRHALGALLVEQGQLRAAEQIYREDLGLATGLSRASIHPNNIWSLKGLYDCLNARNETVEIKHVKANLDLAQARADHIVKASCACALSKQA
ncbi:MAG: hypothetical protein ACO2YK_13415, partial [Paracoccaceae bacterium]